MMPSIKKEEKIYVLIIYEYVQACKEARFCGPKAFMIWINLFMEKGK